VLRRYGDVTVLDLGSNQRLAIACDSVGAIGPKPLDLVKVSGYVVGRFACRVPLMEIMAIGARPLLVVDALCVEPEPLGSEILAGIIDEAKQAGLNDRQAVTGSTEKNVPTSQTALGVTALGLVTSLRWGLAVHGHRLICVGVPAVGSEVSLHHNTIADIPTIQRALSFPGLGDVVPVGSSGIGWEARELAARSNLVFHPNAECGLDFYKSAGPSTCFLASIPPCLWQSFRSHMVAAARPLTWVGTLEDPKG